MNEAAYQQASKLLATILTDEHFKDRQAIAYRLLAGKQEQNPPSQNARVYFTPNTFDPLREALTGNDTDLSVRLADDAYEKGAYDIAAAAAPHTGRPEMVPFIMEKWNGELFDNHVAKNSASHSRFEKELELHANSLIHFASQNAAYRESPALLRHLNNAYALGIAYSTQTCRQLCTLDFAFDQRNKNILGHKISEFKKAAESGDSDKRHLAYERAARLAQLMPDDEFARDTIMEFISRAHRNEGKAWTRYVTLMLTHYHGNFVHDARVGAQEPAANDPAASIAAPAAQEKPSTDAPSVVLE
jgi:hypothetical protein